MFICFDFYKCHSVNKYLLNTGYTKITAFHHFQVAAKHPVIHRTASSMLRNHLPQKDNSANTEKTTPRWLNFSSNLFVTVNKFPSVVSFFKKLSTSCSTLVHSFSKPTAPLTAGVFKFYSNFTWCFLNPISFFSPCVVSYLLTCILENHFQRWGVNFMNLCVSKYVFMLLLNKNARGWFSPETKVVFSHTSAGRGPDPEARN